MITPKFISPFCNGVNISPDPEQPERELIIMGGCLTAEDERLKTQNKHKMLLVDPTGIHPTEQFR